MHIHVETETFLGNIIIRILQTKLLHGFPADIVSTFSISSELVEGFLVSIQTKHLFEFETHRRLNRMVFGEVQNLWNRVRNMIFEFGSLDVTSSSVMVAMRW